jgi:tetratricopeptide (TPR) repeat protein
MNLWILPLLVLGLEDAPPLPEALMSADKLGHSHYRVSTTNAQAQAYFDQGLAFIYDYSYRGARRSFAEALKADPNCAMASWGMAVANGNTINSPEIGEKESAAALGALENAARQPRMTGLERELIGAQRVRFAVPAPTNRQSLNLAYAGAMRQVWHRHPKDATVGALFADALIDCHPWDQWTLEGKPKEGTEELMKTVNAVLRLDRNHLHALHLYIHAYEASPFPGRAKFAADRLENLAPGLSHLQHMPCHIYAHTGDWDKGVEANLNCLRSGDEYLASRKMLGRRGVLFDHYEIALAYAACMRGQSALARATIDGMFQEIPPQKAVEEFPDMDGDTAQPLEVRKRFGDWDGILAAPDFGPESPISNAIRMGDRAIAYAAKGDLENAERERQAFETLYLAIPETRKAGLDTARQLLSVERHLVAGEILIRRKETIDAGLAELAQAVEAQDHLHYSEPPQWIIPARHALGAALLRVGKHAQAEAVYTEDLRRNPRNGWSLAGLARACRALGKRREAEKALKEFRVAWKDADVKIATSCLCLP